MSTDASWLDLAKTKLRRGWWRLRRTRRPLLALIGIVLLVAIATAVRGCTDTPTNADATPAASVVAPAPTA